MPECKPGKVKCQKCNRCKTKKNFSYRKKTCNRCYYESDAYRKQRDRYLRKTYGLSISDYEALLEAQGGGCAVCGGGSAGKNLAVDHNHKTGQVRGLLCKRHNSALARWVRNVEEAYATWVYLAQDGQRVDFILERKVRVPE